MDPGGLIPIPNSAQPLSSAQPGAEQISFVQNGLVLVVTEKGANNIDTFVVSAGVAAPGVFTSAVGARERQDRASLVVQLAVVVVPR